jgi:hypothetical protein
MHHRGARQLGQLVVPFQKTIKLEKSEFCSSINMVIAFKHSSMNNFRKYGLVYWIFIALVGAACDGNYFILLCSR